MFVLFNEYDYYDEMQAILNGSITNFSAHALNCFFPWGGCRSASLTFQNLAIQTLVTNWIPFTYSWMFLWEHNLKYIISMLLFLHERTRPCHYHIQLFVFFRNVRNNGRILIKFGMNIIATTTWHFTFYIKSQNTQLRTLMDSKLSAQVSTDVRAKKSITLIKRKQTRNLTINSTVA
jgi:hypothetical protein